MGPTGCCTVPAWIRTAGAAVALAATALTGLTAVAEAQSPTATVRVVADAGGTRLQVDGRDFFVKGVNWDYFPIGQNYAYSLWTQPDDIIRDALDREMGLLKSMGANAIRVYAGMPPRWVRYIYERFGIWSIVNHPLGRYGLTVDGAWMPNTDYSNPKVRAQIIGEVDALVKEFEGTPGMLMWLLGNENNYGLTWKSAATENLPVGERDAAKAKYLYSLFGDAIASIKRVDTSRPVAMANGDLQYLDLIAQEAKGLDIFGANVYRGTGFGDLFQRVKTTLNVPVMFTEFGADAWNARESREDQLNQARYVVSQWREIYEQSAGKGLVGNAIGGFTFQWSDGWWKYGQETGLDVHDVNASWAADAYQYDFTRGENNMNEEWWGIVAKGPADSRGQFQLYPRAAFYGLQQAYQLDPYAADLPAVRAHFAAIEPSALTLKARADAAALGGDGNQKLRVAGMRLELSTYTTGGDRISTPGSAVPSATARPAFTGFDRMESYFVDIEAKPTERLTARVSFNVLGNVPDNPIDEIFYENRGRTRVFNTTTGQFSQDGIERLRLYRASVVWDEKDFRLEAFNRTGHYHWGYEGDFFGLYREANYGRNIDIYNGEAPLGVEFTGKRTLDGLKLAVGPELWWGANPTAIAKYRRKFMGMDVTGMFQEDLARLSAGAAQSSFAIPIPQARRATVHAATTWKGFGIEAGGMWSGGQRIGQQFQVVEGEPGNYQVLLDEVKQSDAFGGKAKVTFSRGRLNWYAQTAAMGLIADGGPTSVQTFTGWNLKDTGLNNQWNAVTGFTWMMGNLQIAPNFLYQKPIVGPVPGDAPLPARKRNVVDDPFAVRANRETVAGELLLTWDPTPATWMYQWDNDMREDAEYAASIGYTLRHLPTTQDAAIGILADGRTTFAFPGATPARDLWEVRGRFIAKTGADSRVIANVYTGTAEPNGDSQRLVSRSGVDLRAVKGQYKLVGAWKLNDFGPFDYHRDFNLTFPTQYMTDFSYVFGRAQWWDVPETKVGIRGTLRTLDRFSPRYCPVRVPDGSGTPTCDPLAPGLADGREWEIRTYLTIAW
ncbi:MAG: glycoside hydrolase family 2 TIM barrel-domain containing protein [Gemmatimonadaceae bacterium]